MRKIWGALVLAFLASQVFTPASATGIQWTSYASIAQVEIIGDAGGFVVYLSGFSDPNCSSNPTGIYVYPNAEGVTPAGVNQMLATVLMAQATGGTISIEYNNTGNVSTGLCYGVYLRH